MLTAGPTSASWVASPTRSEKAWTNRLWVTLAGSALAEPNSDCVAILDSRALAADVATSGARTPLETAAVAAPSPAMKRRRPGDFGAPFDSRAISEAFASVAVWLLAEK